MYIYIYTYLFTKYIRYNICPQWYTGNPKLPDPKPKPLNSALFSTLHSSFCSFSTLRPLSSAPFTASPQL